MKKVIFVGAGEYAESVYDSMAKEEYDLIGFVDEYKKGYHMGKPILAATIEEVFNFRDYAYFISIGDTEPRKRQFETIKRLGLETMGSASRICGRMVLITRVSARRQISTSRTMRMTENISVKMRKTY